MALGDLEQLILLALARFDGHAHGAAIALEIEAAAGRVVSPGALHTVLERLQDKGLVESRIGDTTPARGGRRRRLYTLLPAGAREVRDWYAGVQRLAADAALRLDSLAEGGG